MNVFDPIKYIANSEIILESDGTWPSFYEASVESFKFWRGDLRAHDNVYILPIIEASIEFLMIEQPYGVIFKFHDCSEIKMSDFNYDNVILGITYTFVLNGYYADGKTEVPPSVKVEIGKAGDTVALSFICNRIEIIDRYTI